MARLPRSITLALALGAAMAACEGGGDSGEPGRPEVGDPTGAPVIETSANALETLPELGVDTVVVVEGDADGVSLAAVTGVHRFDDGRLAILDLANRHVVFTGPDGRVIRTVGRDGDGPGEFRAPSRLYPLGGDSVLVIDGRTSRMTVIGPGGDVGRTTPLEGGAGPGLPVGLLADGTLAHTAPQGGAASRMESPTPVMQEGFVRLFSPDGTLADSLGPFPDHTTYATDRGYTSPVFSPRTDFAPWEDGVWVATGLAPELTKIRRNGSVERIVRWAAPPRPVTQADRDRLLAVSLGRAASANDSAQTRGFHEEALFANRVPPYRRIFTDVSTGAVWIEPYDLSYGDDPTRWLVLSADGHALGRVDLPPGFRFWEADDGVVGGVVFDEVGVPSVIVMRVTSLTP